MGNICRRCCFCCRRCCCRQENDGYLEGAVSYETLLAAKNKRLTAKEEYLMVKKMNSEQMSKTANNDKSTNIGKQDENNTGKSSGEIDQPTSKQ